MLCIFDEGETPKTRFLALWIVDDLDCAALNFFVVAMHNCECPRQIV